ncbi:hypothetical protein QOZ96_002690 [Brevundimonas nasdae]|uniref:hypothetical protein n=1 Tax=Brevundimonas nasdae TaxID=172043 RepID=UPI00191208B5|nr:hypothetical protein [Brevundimonas nasdae]MBK6026085.1 hypothetical protein [Brevundimonas nasdae]MDQ0452734.1 hypothetical protein [Brevundimonas nasdae]
MISSVLLAAIMSTALASPPPRMQDTRTDEPGGRMEQAEGSARVQHQPGAFRDDGEGDSLTPVRKTGEPTAHVFTPADGCWRLTQHLS